MRDITLGDTFTFGFTTRSFTTGVPGTLGGTPALSVKEGANDTPITAGVSLDVDTCATPVTGLNEGTVVATSGNGYEAGKSYFAYISAGTVGGVSVVGEVVEQFTVQAGAAFTRLGAPAGASVSADVAVVQADTNDIQARLPAALTVDGNIKADTLRVGGTLQTAGDIPAMITVVDDFVDTEVTAIKAQTDKMTFTVPNQLDVNIQSVNDTAVTGNGSAGTPWGP